LRRLKATCRDLRISIGRLALLAPARKIVA